MKRHFIILLFISFFLIQCVHQNLENKRSISSLPRDVATLQPSQIREEFQVCRSSSRLYLEEDILQMPIEYIRPHDQDWRSAIPMKCIQFAQKNFRGRFANCEGEEARPTADALKPCMNESYVTLVYNAYHDVMDCFNLDPKDFFLQIMIESGFHINAINKTGFDSGLAQFTANGILKVTANNRIERARRLMLESSRPSCQRISSTIGEFDITFYTPDKRCSMIALPKNPYRGMFFNYIHTMLDQIEMESMLERELAAFKQLKTIFTDRIKRQLVYLAYNRGMMGVSRLLQGYLQNRQRASQILTETDFDLNQNLERAKAIMRLDPEKKKILKRAKIKKLTFAEYAVINNASYVSEMVGAQDYVRHHLGEQCSRF